MAINGALRDSERTFEEAFVANFTVLVTVLSMVLGLSITRILLGLITVFQHVRPVRQLITLWPTSESCISSARARLISIVDVFLSTRTIT